MKNKKPKFPGFKLIPHTSGVILDGVWVKETGTEVIIDMAWGGNLHFKPEDEMTEEDHRNNKLREIFEEGS